MNLTLQQRQQDYESAYSYQFIRRVPIVIRADGQNFYRLCRKLQQPYDPVFLESMSETMLRTAMEQTGAVFAYLNHNNITFILRTEEEPWFNNAVQKMASVTAAMATMQLNRSLSRTELDLVGDCLFSAVGFAVPSITEAVNNLINEQQKCYRIAVSLAAQSFFTKKLGRAIATKRLHGQNTKEKLLMLQESGYHFDELLGSFKAGVAAYKIPIVVPTQDGHITKKKWTINWEVPDLSEAKELVYTIVANGVDVFREKYLEIK